MSYKPEPNPCPTCDKEPKVYDEIHSKTVSVQCTGCGLTSGQHATDEDAIAAWNMKPLSTTES